MIVLSLSHPALKKEQGKLLMLNESTFLSICLSSFWFGST